MISAILLNWKRPFNIPPIVESLRKHVGETIVWDNSGTLEDIDGATVVRSDRNRGTFGRYLAARHARHDVIYTQDDDCLVRNIPALYERFSGTEIVAGLRRGHYRAEAHKRPWVQLGWGSLFKREWLAVTEFWINRYGIDALLESKFDRIFTILFGRHDPVLSDIEPLKGPNGKPSERDRNSLWLQPNHRSLVKEAADKALALRGEIANAC